MPPILKRPHSPRIRGASRAEKTQPIYFLFSSLTSGGTGISLPQLDRKSLAKGIASIKSEKAVPQGSAPASIYRLCVSVVANNYWDYLEALPPSDPTVPLASEVPSCHEHISPSTKASPSTLPSLLATAKSADLSFIPKPSKPASKPENLRSPGQE